MMLSRCLLLVPAICVAHHRHLKAQSKQVVKAHANYRERFEQLDKDDNKQINNKNRQDVSKKFGYPEVVSVLEQEIIDKLHYMIVMYDKPLCPERRIRVRATLLPYLESSEGERLKLFEHILEYYEVL